MRVAQLAKAAAVSGDTVRHYTDLGLLKPRRDPHNGELTAQGRSWLGPGDANWFERDAGLAHRCRNLSRHDTAYTLHIYGGELPDHRADEPRKDVSAWIAQAQRGTFAGQPTP